MTDTELLELAAKAAGLELVLWQQDGTPHATRPGGTVSWRWNPLTDDGDALRLAITKNLAVSVVGESVHQSHETIVLFELADGVPGRLTQAHDGDPRAATRRAIVRAAAMTQPKEPT